MKLPIFELGIPIEKTPTREPIIGHRAEAEHWEAERYGRHQHSNRSLPSKDNHKANAAA